jgi:hypothetical protein
MVMENNDNNGKKTIVDIAREKTFLGATVTLDELVRRDGQIAESLDKANGQRLGVIQRALTPSTDEDYRQILKLAVWKSPEEMDKAVNALAECDITGADTIKKIILDRITAHSAGTSGYLLHEAFEALTHTTFTSQNIEQRKKWNGSRNNTNSPLSK